MIHFHPLQVKKVQRETQDCVTITFNVPEELKENFLYRQGQSITVRKILEGNEVRRSYSICSSPKENQLKVAVKKVEGGIFSNYANSNLHAGDVLDVMPPVGNFFTDLNPLNKKTYIAFAAGSGITPVISVIKATFESEPLSNVTLVYGNRSKSSIIFKEELEALKDKYLDRFSIYHILSREITDAEIKSGRIDRKKLDLLFDKVLSIQNCNEFFICGPDEMIFTVRIYLEEKNIAKEKIHYELFTVPGQKKSVSEPEETGVASGDTKSSVTLKVDGIFFNIEVPYNGESILDTALKAGADLPYACKGGVCTTCRAMLMEGEVKMDANWSLEKDELEKGYILTCQSHPLSQKIIINYDTN